MHQVYIQVQPPVLHDLKYLLRIYSLHTRTFNQIFLVNRVGGREVAYTCNEKQHRIAMHSHLTYLNTS